MWRGSPISPRTPLTPSKTLRCFPEPLCFSLSRFTLGSHAHRKGAHQRARVRLSFSIDFILSRSQYVLNSIPVGYNVSPLHIYYLHTSLDEQQRRWDAVPTLGIVGKQLFQGMHRAEKRECEYICMCLCLSEMISHIFHITNTK